ncbi:hypothetical protein Y032_0101g3335 [Ancylostoma ceylanicum]|uniref:Uncharacterized protein n=1 Tax=Ancylostoma ceylanicum TaxID=53326 RepID=A0A016THF7_9BILA|nr:hypothetical protein Y032_0101g3335 [Ancylostoma ceylanicum]
MEELIIRRSPYIRLGLRHRRCASRRRRLAATHARWPRPQIRDSNLISRCQPSHTSATTLDVDLRPSAAPFVPFSPVPRCSSSFSYYPRKGPASMTLDVKPDGDDYEYELSDIEIQQIKVCPRHAIVFCLSCSMAVTSIAVMRTKTTAG